MVTLGKQLQKLITVLDEYSDGSATLRRDNSQVRKPSKIIVCPTSKRASVVVQSKPDAKAVIEYIGARLSNRIKVRIQRFWRKIRRRLRSLWSCVPLCLAAVAKRRRASAIAVRSCSVEQQSALALVLGYALLCASATMLDVRNETPTFVSLLQDRFCRRQTKASWTWTSRPVSNFANFVCFSLICRVRREIGKRRRWFDDSCAAEANAELESNREV